MEPARDQLARPLPTLPVSQYTQGTRVSRGNDLLSFTNMHSWDSFASDIQSFLQLSNFDHQIPVHNETELYAVGNEVGLIGRFVRDVCDPVIKSITSLPYMENIRFADIQALTWVHEDDPIPDLCLGITGNQYLDFSNVLMVGKIYTPWTTRLYKRAVYHDKVALEPLVGQVVRHMRTYFLRYAFISTYKSTIFVKRAGDSSFLLSEVFDHDRTDPSVRQLFAGFCMLAAGNPNYCEDRDLDVDILLNPQALHSSQQQMLDQSNPKAIVTSTVTTESIIITTGSPMPIVVNCVREIKATRCRDKAVYAAEIDGKRVIAKCWAPRLEHVFDAEAGVYERLASIQPEGHHLFAKAMQWGAVICSTLFPTGHVLIMEEREGEMLAKIWHELSDDEQKHVRAECLLGINAMRAISVRLDDAGKHNILYSREKRLVTFLDFELAVECPPTACVPTDYEMCCIFRFPEVEQGDHAG